MSAISVTPPTELTERKTFAPFEGRLPEPDPDQLERMTLRKATLLPDR